MSRAFILNFNAPRSFDDILYFFEAFNGSNINILMRDFETGETNWSVPKQAVPGDIVVFMCAKSAKANIGMAASHLPEIADRKLRKFVDEQKKLYQLYSGCLIGCGVVRTKPVFVTDYRWWMSDINQLFKFAETVHINDFRSFITINRTGSVTPLTEVQQEQLMWLVSQKNPGIVIPDPFGKEPHEQDQPIDVLRQAAEARASAAVAIKSQTTVYYRDPTIAEYVRKRAQGHCEFCKREAPFRKRDGEPYLECHHIKPLSEGGRDSPDNCVALCKLSPEDA